MRRAARTAALGASAFALAVVTGAPAVAAPPPGFDPMHQAWPDAVGTADCRPGDPVETGLQGDVPREDRLSGRSARGYACNIDLVGRYQGDGAGITSTSYDRCSYLGSTFPSFVAGDRTPGVRVVDNADPTNPRLSTVLDAPAMAGGTWESLKVNRERGLLVGTGVGLLEGAGTLAVYDVSRDCAHPTLLNTGAGQPSMPVPVLTHEGEFSPDGRTYWASGVAPGYLTAIDLTDPADPVVVWGGLLAVSGHGMGFSPDGRRLYLSNMAGVTVVDVSAVQDRAPRAVVGHPLPVIGDRLWTDGQFTQHALHATYGGREHVFVVDEAGSGGVKVFDAADPGALALRNTLKLQINEPRHTEAWARSAAANGVFGYDAHYCSLDRPDDPQALACGWQQSGIRVFDVRDPEHVREIAYYNPPGQTGKTAFDLPNSMHATVGAIVAPPFTGVGALARNVLQGTSGSAVTTPESRVAGADMTADWCFSPPEFRGDELWVTCSDNGFMTLRLDPSVYPPR